MSARAETNLQPMDPALSYPHFPLAMIVAAVLAGLCAVVVAVDALARAVARSRERRHHREVGVYGVVVDAAGRVLGTYVDPFADRVRQARVHDDASPWGGKPDPLGNGGWAWEGFGHSEAEARFAADRLRQRHLRLFPWLAGEADDEEEHEPWRG